MHERQTDISFSLKTAYWPQCMARDSQATSRILIRINMSNFYDELFKSFPYKVLISLPERSDRRRRLKKKFAAHGLDFAKLEIEIFDGFRFSEDNGFPTAGVRGCFTSHKEILREASKRDSKVLILEDDLQLLTPVSKNMDKVLDFARSGPWDVLYFGYLSPVFRDQDVRIIEHYTGPTIGGHFYAVDPDFARKIVDFMDDCERRPAGHPDGGPMYRDAAFNFFFDRNPELNRAIVCPPLGGQFSSRTDLGGSRLFDRILGISTITSLIRELRD